MSLKATLYEDMKTAMKSRDTQRLETIRFAISVIKNVEIDHGEQSDAQVESILRKQVKQMREAVDQFKQGNRLDLVEAEEAKMAILEDYLPKQLDSNEIEALIHSVISETENPNFGTIMPRAMQMLAGKADGKIVSEIVRRLLS